MSCNNGFFVQADPVSGALKCVPCSKKISTCGSCDIDYDRYLLKNFAATYGPVLAAK